MMPTIATLFSGFGLVETGAKEKGYDPIWGVEIDPRIAQVYRENHGDHIIVEDIRKVDPLGLKCPDVLWASPSCRPFSRARCDNRKHPDQDLGLEILRFVEALCPPWVIIENVPGYVGSEPFNAIIESLKGMGYWVYFSVLDAHNFGVPQTRKRVIITAQRFMDCQLLSEEQGGSWYEAIADLIPDLPWASLTEKQKPLATKTEPLLIERIGYYKSPKTARSHEPSWTLRATLADDRKGGRRNNFINVLDKGDCYNLTSRAFARLQSVPDSFILSGDVAIDIMGLGNGVPCNFAKNLLPCC